MSHVRIEEMLAESGLTGEEGGVVASLASLAELVEDAPAPSAELAELFGPASPREVTRLSGRRSAVAGALVLALSGVGATGLSAAANTLPRPLQHQVSQFSHRYLPFRLPEPPRTDSPPQGLAHLGPGTPTPSGEARADRPSRSMPARPNDPAATPLHPGATSLRPTGESASPSPSAAPSPESSDQQSPEQSPAVASSTASSPAAQPYASGSPSPSDRPHDGGGKGDAEATPDKGAPGKSSGHKPVKDHGSAQKPGKGSGQSPSGGGSGNGGGSSPTPGPAPAPTTPTPQPDPPLPTLPLPDPLPGVDLTGGTGTN